MRMNPYAILVCVLAAVILLTVFATRKNIGRRAAAEVLATLILAFFSLLFFGLSLVIVNERLRFALHELKFLPLSFIAPCSMLVYFKFTERELPQRAKLLLCVIPVFSVVAALTNSFHHFFRKEMFIIFHNGASFIEVESAWGYWLYSAYSYIVFVAGICVLAKNYIKMPRIYRGQLGLMIFTATVAVLISLAVAMGAVADYGDISLVTCAITVIVQYMTIVNYSYKRVRTRAWNLIVGDLDSLVVIFDHNDRLVDSNRDASEFSDVIASGEAYLANSGQDIDGSVVSPPRRGGYYSVNEKRLYDNKSRYTGRVLVIKDVSAAVSAAKELEYIATHDHLTGLQNRLAFRNKLKLLGGGKLPAALICVNIIGMKLINDIFGNEYGDRVIIRAAATLNRLIGDGGCCMRLGGDEFGLVLEGAGRPEAEAFLANVRDCLLDSNETVEVNLETSLAVMTDSGRDAGQLFADLAGTMRKSGGAKARSVSPGFMSYLQGSLERLSSGERQRRTEITRLCLLTADILSLDESEKERLRLLSSMSDIGLISTPPAILRGRGDLSNEQWAEWKLHTIKGHNIAQSVLELSDISNEILSHHERYDGYGFPSRLRGDDIPVLARVFSAAEFYVCAPAEKAAPLLRARSGTQFDPAIVEAVLSACQGGDGLPASQ